MPPERARVPRRAARWARLLVHLAWWDLVAQYFGSWVGLLWNVLLPGLVIGVYLVVFELSPRFAFGGWDAVGGYGVNLVAALVPWLMFQEGVSRAASSFVDQRHLLTQIPLPPALFPLASVGAATFRHGVALLLLAAILLLSGIATGWRWAGLLYAFPVLLLLTCGCALVAACLAVLHRDFAPAVSAMMLPLFFATPVVYPPHVVPGKLLLVMDMNPMTPIVTAYRDLLVTGRDPMAGGLVWSAATGLVVLAIGVVLVRRIGPDLPERL